MFIVTTGLSKSSLESLCHCCQRLCWTHIGWYTIGVPGGIKRAMILLPHWQDCMPLTFFGILTTEDKEFIVWCCFLFALLACDGHHDLVKLTGIKIA
jgi:hypothetical protein